MSRRVLIVSATPTHPANSGSRARLLGLAETFRGLGHDAAFCLLRDPAADLAPLRAGWGADRFFTVGHVNPSTRRPLHRRILRRARRILTGAVPPPHPPDGYGIDDWYDPRATEPLLRLVEKQGFDTVLVLYVFHTGFFPHLPARCLKLIDTQDVYTDRHAGYTSRGLAPVWYSTRREEEKKGLDRADGIVAIQSHDAAYFRSLTARPVIVVGHPVRIAPAPDRPDPAPTLAYVGSDNADNIDAMRDFVAHMLPGIVRRVPGARLLLAGAIARHPHDWGPFVTLVPDPDLADLYARARIVVNPVRIGTGLKIKTMEALGFGKAVVTTRFGAAGLEAAGGAALAVAETEEEMGGHIVRLLTDPAAARAQGEAAVRFCAACNAEVVRALAACLAIVPAPHA